jgi:thioredoxin reductase (NADPH)
MNTRQDIENVDIAVVGAGPAGLMAAMQAKRLGVRIALLEKNRPGGQALAAHLVENFPGVAPGISGKDLIQRFIDQVKSCGIEIRHEAVVSISKSGDSFALRTDEGELHARAVIVASGLTPRRLEVPGEAELSGKYIFSYEDVDSLPCRGKTALVIGSGDAAFDQALSLSKFASRVSIAMRSGHPKCLPMLLSRARLAGIEILAGHDVRAFRSSGGRLSVEFSSGRRMEVDLADVCIGKEKGLDFIDKNLLGSDVPGLFFAGDCKRDGSRHISMACGDGIAAAVDAAEYISRVNKGDIG